MKQSDLEFLLKLEDTICNNHKRLLQKQEQEKSDLINKRDTMNHNFLLEQPDIQVANYTRFRAIENQRINQQIAQLDLQIEMTKENLRESLKNNKKYTLLNENIITARKKCQDKFQENQADEYTIFKFSK